MEKLTTIRKLLEIDQIAIGAAAAGIAALLTNPLEVLKTRMQLQGELTRRGAYPVHYKSIRHGLRTIVRREGYHALTAGLLTSFLYQVLYNGLRLGTYEHLSQLGFITDQNHHELFLRTVLWSGITGIVSMTISSPFYIMKVQMQSQAAENVAFGYQHDHTGIFEGLRSIIRSCGWKGLYRGYFPSVPRQFMQSSSQLTAFDFTKTFLKQNVSFIDSAFVASIAAGIVVAVLTSPLDLINTRMTNQGLLPNGQGVNYTNSFDCARKIWKYEGIQGFLKGFRASLLIRVPFSIISLTVWDKVKEAYSREEPDKLDDNFDDIIASEA